MKFFDTTNTKIAVETFKTQNKYLSKQPTVIVI